MGGEVMTYSSLIFLAVAIIILIVAYKKNLSTKKIVERIDRMLDLAVKGELPPENFDESILSKVESKFKGYLMGLLASEQNLQQQKENIEALISDISHQTKTPIANISLYAQLLIESQQKEPDNTNAEESNPSTEYIKEVIFQTDKLNFLIQNLVKTSRLETGIIKLNPCMNDIAPTMEGVIKSVANKAKGKNIKISYPEAKGYTAFFDPKWTEEAIYNIVDNGIKYSPIDRELKINIQEYPLFLRIDIVDQGIGITEADIPKIFQRFYRGGAAGSSEGVGIGLYLAREIIQGEGGYIKVTSKVGEGSVFSIFLPKGK